MVRQPTRRLTAVAATAAVALAAGLVGLVLHRQDAAADAAAAASASARAELVSDVRIDEDAIQRALGERGSAELGETVRQQARTTLLDAVEKATATLVASEDEVADEALRDTLADAVQRAKHALESTPADASPAPDGPTGAGESAALLRALAAEVGAAEAVVHEAHDAFVATREAERAAQQAQAARAKPPSSQQGATGSTGSSGSGSTGGSGADRCTTTYDGPPFYTSPPTKGGDGSNGKLPPSMLTATSWGVDPKGTRYYLRSAATAALERLDAAFRAQFGHHLDLDLTYRDYATQVAMRDALGSIAAVPGTSMHGTGLALDVPELPCEYGYGTPQHTWLTTTGRSFGWVQPSWAAKHGSNPEYWHYEYTG